MSYKVLREEAEALGIYHYGLVEAALRQRIEDKKNGTGVYENALIDPDTSALELMAIADDMEIKTHTPVLSQAQLMEKISKKLKDGYKLGVRYNPSPRLKDMRDDELIESYKQGLESQQTHPSTDLYYRLENYRGEMIFRGITI